MRKFLLKKIIIFHCLIVYLMAIFSMELDKMSKLNKFET